jgi:excisionase family DNA binding protein
VSEAAIPSDTSGYVGPSAAARRLGVSAERVRQLATEGKLASTVTPLGRLFRLDDVDALARARAAGKGPGA